MRSSTNMKGPHALPGVPSPGRHHGLAARHRGVCSARFRSVARVQPVPRRLESHCAASKPGTSCSGRVGLTHERPPWGIDRCASDGATSRCARKPPTCCRSARCCTSPRSPRVAACPRDAEGAARRAAVGPLRDPAARHGADAAPRAGRVGHRLAQRARRRPRRRQLRVRQLHRVPHPLARGARSRDPRDRGVPAVRRRARRHRGDVRGRQRLHAPHAHADGGPDRHAGRPHGREHARHQQADLVVRAQRDHHRADALRRRRAGPCTRASCSSRRSSP